MNTEKMKQSGQWWDDGCSWNTTIGCTPCSDKCLHCYAKGIHDKRHKAYLAGKKLPKQYAKPFSEIQLLPERLETPLHWREPRIIFVDSMSDLFHEQVPFEFIDDVFERVWDCPQHTFLVCTKRIKRAKEFYKIANQYHRIPKDNLWLGCTPSKPEDIETLLEIPAAHHWVSYEPLLEKPDLPLPCKNQKFWSNISWLVTGCETGANARYCPIEYIESIVEQCEVAGVPVWVKSVDIGTPEKFRQVHKFADLPLSVRKREAPFIGDRK